MKKKTEIFYRDMNFDTNSHCQNITPKMKLKIPWLERSEISYLLHVRTSL